MRKFKLLILLILLFNICCSDTWYDTEYIIKNELDTTIFVNFNEFNDEINYHNEYITNFKTERFASFFDLVDKPTPSEVFGKIEIYEVDIDGTNYRKIYEQFPVSNSLWQYEENDEWNSPSLLDIS